MDNTLFTKLIEECKAAVEVSKTEGQAAINATERMIEGLASVLHRHDKSFNHKEFLKKTLFPID